MLSTRLFKWPASLWIQLRREVGHGGEEEVGETSSCDSAWPSSFRLLTSVASLFCRWRRWCRRRRRHRRSLQWRLLWCNKTNGSCLKHSEGMVLREPTLEIFFLLSPLSFSLSLTITLSIDTHSLSFSQPPNFLSLFLPFFYLSLTWSKQSQFYSLSLTVSFSLSLKLSPLEVGLTITILSSHPPKRKIIHKM